MNPALTPVTRFAPGGIGNVPQNHPAAGLPMPFPMLGHQYLNDFDTYTAGEWTVTETQAGATQALADADGGILVLTNTTGGTDINAIQLANETFTFTSGKALYFESRLKVSNATLAAFAVGLQAANATPLTVANGVVFTKPAAAAIINLVAAIASTRTTQATGGSVVADTYTTLAFWYDGESSIYYAQDGVLLGSIANTNMPTTELAISVGLQNGSGAAHVLSCDYLYAWKAR